MTRHTFHVYLFVVLYYIFLSGVPSSTAMCALRECEDITVVCHNNQTQATEMGIFFGMAKVTLHKIHNLHSSPCTERVVKQRDSIKFHS